MKYLVSALFAAAVAAGVAAMAVAQERDFLDIRFRHDMAINGEKATATGTGYGEARSGVMVIDFTISNYIAGYSNWASSVITNAGGGGGPVVGVVAAGGANPTLAWLRASPENRLRHQKQTRDDYADLTTRFDVWIERGTLNIEVATEGEAKYPPLTGVATAPMVYSAGQRAGAARVHGVRGDRAARADVASEGVANYPPLAAMAIAPMVYSAVPLASGAVEQLEKALVTEKGDTITTNVVIRFPEEAKRPPGDRVTRVAVLRESRDGLAVSLMYHNVFE